MNIHQFEKLHQAEHYREATRQALADRRQSDRRRTPDIEVIAVKLEDIVSQVDQERTTGRIREAVEAAYQLGLQAGR